MNIRLEGVAKTYPDGTQVLKGIDMEVTPGEGVVLLGANGCGKSTLLRCIIGLESISKGEICIDNQSINKQKRRDLRRLRSNIGSVFQQFNLVNNLTVFQNVLFGRLGKEGIIRSLNLTCTKTNREKAMHCLERVGLADLASKRTDSLSGGQQQRVAIARMLMQEASIILADEPVASLDPRAGREVMDLLFEIVNENKLTVICVLHQLELAMEYGQRIVGLKNGKVFLDESPERIDQSDISHLYDADSGQANN